MGNFDAVTTNGVAQARTTNRQNEVLTVAGATSPTYDANGNLTKDETGKRYEYDGWNRPVRVKDAAGTTTLATYAYDGSGRRVTVTAGGTTTQLVYSSAWQVLEERVGGVTKAQNVWSPVYVDAMVVRDRDADGNAGTGTGGLEERLWVQQDANFNVTALTDGTGAAVERFVYDPFGAATVLTGAFAARSASLYAWQYLHQGGRVDAASGLIHFRNRDYSPTLGRWVTMDPIGYDAGDVNLYRVVGNNPTLYTDPSGKIAPLIVLGILGGAIFVGSSGRANAPTSSAEATLGPPPIQEVVDGAIIGGVAGGVIGAGIEGGVAVAGAGGVYIIKKLAKSPPKTSIATKIEGQLGKRGWTVEGVNDAIKNPVKTVKTTDTRNIPGGGKMNDPATKYYSKDGGYVIRNDKTGDIVQVSNRKDPNWVDSPAK